MDKHIHKFLDINSLPRKGKLISFKDAIGMNLYFEYRNIKNDVHIEAYDPKTHMLQISFPTITNNQIFTIHTDNFKQVKFGNMIDDNITFTYKYNIGDIIDCNMGNITILDKATKYVGENKNIPRRFYFIECNLCHNQRWIEASDINKQKHQFCNKCGIHTYYPEKFLSNLLDQLQIPYITQFNKTHESWCKRYLYDFFITLNNKRIIIETHGNQHYSKIWNNSKYSLQNIQNNDLAKETLALQNNITNYIIIDCRKSNLEWIKHSVINSELFSILNIDKSSIDWNQCHRFATSDFVRLAAELYNSDYSMKMIEEKLKRSKQMIYKYLVTAYQLGLCATIPDNRNYVSVSIYKDGDCIGNFLTLTEAIRNLKEKYNVKICSATIRNYMDTNAPYKGFLFYNYQREVCVA